MIATTGDVHRIGPAPEHILDGVLIVGQGIVARILICSHPGTVLQGAIVGAGVKFNGDFRRLKAIARAIEVTRSVKWICYDPAVPSVAHPFGKAAARLVHLASLGVLGSTPQSASNKINQPMKQAHQSSFWSTGVLSFPLLIL